jgi:hypothetical protein
MTPFFQKIKDFLNKRKYTTNEDAGAIIRGFVLGTLGTWDWDDFATVKENNPDADLAIQLCWFFIDEFPPENLTEAMPYFLKVADALESSKFANLDHGKVKESLKKGVLPENIKNILGTKE